MKKVRVLLSTYNGEHFLEDQLLSLAQQQGSIMMSLYGMMDLPIQQQKYFLNGIIKACCLGIREKI